MKHPTRKFLCLLFVVLMTACLLAPATAAAEANETIKYDANGGSGYMPDNIAYYGQYFPLPNCTFTPPKGHEFSHWTIKGNEVIKLAPGDKMRFTPSAPHTTTFVAVWKLNGNPFVDVAADAFYYEPVQWAVRHDPAITVGTDATHFSPDATCTRAQAVTFLWRAMNCPAPKTTKNPFTDVSAGDWYYKPVLWAAENGITGGVGGGRFDPDGVCNRSQIVTFLWRATKPHAAQSAGSTFSDVPAAEWFAEPVAWAVDKGITYGIGGGKFGPFLDCTRGQIVTFLYRCMK